MNVCYWKEKSLGTYADFPIFAELACNNRYIIPGHKFPGHICIVYGLPILEYPGMMKVFISIIYMHSSFSYFLCTDMAYECMLLEREKSWYIY